jgi:thiaminase/transcriptional activator TenA
MKWSEHVWEQSRPIYHKILELPFIKELMNGTLSKERFFFYLQQDAIYLSEYGKILTEIASRADNQSHAQTFTRFADDCIFVESALHQSYLNGNNHSTLFTASPSCLLYTGYLHQLLSNTSIHIAMAGVLPCFRIYKEVGGYILSHQTKNIDNPYQQWINTYGGEGFEKSVEQATAICDEVAAQSTADEQALMTKAYMQASQLEWMFWNSAWNLEQWPLKETNQ